MTSYLAIVYKNKMKYNRLLEEYSKLDEKYCFVLSRSNHYFWEYGNNKTLSQEDKTKYFKYSNSCYKLLSILDEKFKYMREQIEEVTKAHDEAAENLIDKHTNIKLFRDVCSGGNIPKENPGEDPERNLLFQKMLDEMLEEDSEDCLPEEEEEYSQDIDAI